MTFVMLATCGVLSAQLHPDYENPTVFERGQEKPHATLMPYATMDEALEGQGVLIGREGTRRNRVRFGLVQPVRLRVQKNAAIERDDNLVLNRTEKCPPVVVDLWNALPDLVVTATSVNEFKNALDRFWMNVPWKYDFDDRS